MKDDLDFAALSKSWQQQPIVAENIPAASDLNRARRRQRQQWILLAGDWLGAVVMAITAYWLVTTMPNWLSYISAVFLATGVVMSVYVSWQVHRPMLAYGDWSSSGVLAFRVRACQLSLRYGRYNQLVCLVLLAFVLVLWAVRWWQLEVVPDALLKFYSLVVAPLCVYGVYRLQRHVREKQATLQSLLQLLEEFESSTD